MPLEALFLDFYGTLVEPDESVIVDIAARVMGEPVQSQAVNGFVCLWHGHYVEAIRASNEGAFVSQHRMAVETLAGALEDMEIDGDPEALCEAFSGFWKHPPKREGADAFLERCPLPLYLITNADEDALREALGRLGWDERFAGIVSSENTGAYKPDVRLFRKALQVAEVAAEDVVHIGDSWSADVFGAGRAGICSIWLNPRGREPREGGELLLGSVASLGEIPALLENVSD